MRRLLVTALLVFGTTFASVSNASEQSDICAKIGQLAENIMLLRQKGGVLSDVMGVAKNEQGEENPLIARIVVSAFQSPRFSLDENKAQAATDFRNEVELACFTSD